MLAQIFEDSVFDFDLHMTDVGALVVDVYINHPVQTSLATVSTAVTREFPRSSRFLADLMPPRNSSPLKHLPRTIVDMTSVGCSSLFIM